MHVRLFEQGPANGFAGTAFKEHVVRHYDGRAAMLLQDGEDMLEEVELLVARAGPEIVAVNNERFPGRVARFVDDGDAALLAEGWIGHHKIVFPVLAGKGIFSGDGKQALTP